MGILDKSKELFAKTKKAVTPKFLDKNNKNRTPEQLNVINASEYDKALETCPLLIDNSGVVYNQLLNVGITAVMTRPVVIIRGIDSLHKDTNEGKKLQVFNFRKFLTTYEPSFIARVDLSGFRNYSITTLRKDKTAIAKIAFDDNSGIVTISDEAVFITITKEQ